MAPLLADCVLVVHLLFVLFVVGGMAAIWGGAAAGWRWIRGRPFRVAHLAATTFVAAESLLGVMCPLTVWEDALRGAPAPRSFMARWLHRILYYDFPGWAFTVAYVAFALAVALTWRWIPPRQAGARW
jgi:hypothetical protein